jgi:CubicO group peptidase (beta-lactamase class C family)
MPVSARRSVGALLAAVALTLLTPPAPAQDGTDLTLGQALPGSLVSGSVDFYTLELPEGHFVFGRVEQVSCDVVVTVRGPGGVEVGRFDGPARGPEHFRFRTGEAGRYTIEVAPFEDETGEYSIELRRAEPLAETPDGLVDQLLAPFDDPAAPGGVVAVVRGGEIVYSRAFGSADLAHGVPFTIDTPTNIGSTSKQFTAMAVMLLAERGELSLDDDVREHIPELPDLGRSVTLRHLLTHTSGYREFLNTLVLSGRRLDRGDSIDPAEIIEIVRRQPELQNEPGAEWNYNNTGYSLLATVVSRVGGRPFPDWVRENIFLPLGMDDSFVVDRPGRVIAGAARGYVPDEAGGYRAATDLHGAMGAGGIYTTVGDLARWIGNFNAHRVGSGETFERMTTPFTLTNGRESGYGHGLFVDEFRGLRRIHHGGADIAHRSMVMYFPEIDGAVITQSNNAGFDGSIADQAAVAFFAEHMEDPEHGVEESGGPEEAESAFDPAAFDPEAFDAFAGRYEMDEIPGFILTFRREGDRLLTRGTGQPELEIVPVAENEFRLLVVDARVRFERNAEGEVDAITLFQNGEHRGTRLDGGTAGPTPERLESYAGRYFSEELETFYTVGVEDGALVLSHRRLDDVRLVHNKNHAFTGGFPVAEAEFEVDETGRVTALIVGNGRTRGVRFEPVR